jgi:hypothetical protein
MTILVVFSDKALEILDSVGTSISSSSTSSSSFYIVKEGFTGVGF